MINGNHDKSSFLGLNDWEKEGSSLTLLEKYGVLRYMGNDLDFNIHEITPFMIKSRNIKIAVYPIGY